MIPGAASAGFRFEHGKHLMLSYQWDDQATVEEVKTLFADRGIPTWMDIDDGMKVDIYDSMAQAVATPLTRQTLIPYLRTVSRPPWER